MEENNVLNDINGKLVADDQLVDLPSPPPPPASQQQLPTETIMADNVIEHKVVEKIVEKVKVTDLSINSIIVYLDKAEVCRCLPVNVIAGKTLEVIIDQISNSVDKNSFRIESPNGSVIIQDVTYRTVPCELETQRLDGEVNMLETHQKDLRKQKESLQARQKRFEKQRAVLEKFSDVLVTSQTRTVVDENEECEMTMPFSDAFDPKHMDTLNSFFDVYEKQAEKLDEQIITCKEEMDIVEKAIQDSEKKRLMLEKEKEYSKTRQLSVYMEANESINTGLSLYYVVSDCSWKPSYDIRIINSENKMKITYYAIIQQETGENWNDAEEVFVSTLQPPVGGSVPEIGVQKLGFKSTSDVLSKGSSGVHSPQMRLKSRRKQVKSSIIIPSSPTSHHQLASSILMDGSLYDTLPHTNEEKEGAQSSAIPTCSTLSSKSKSAAMSHADTPSAFYKLPRAPLLVPGTARSIFMEPERHILGYIDMTPVFEYATVPKRAPYAYLRASATNNSDFVVLPGPANVFIDSNYIGKSELKNVSPGEAFTCHIGPDPRIQISYHPMYKYREGGGPVGKTTCLTFKQEMEVVNTHSRNVRVTLTDQLPLAIEEKIKVNLQDPVIKHPEKCDKSKPIRLNKSNLLEWDLDLAPGEKRELVLRYTVEYPSGEYLDLVTDMDPLK